MIEDSFAALLLETDDCREPKECHESKKAGRHYYDDCFIMGFLHDPVRAIN
jgi:hypothetical protein